MLINPFAAPDCTFVYVNENKQLFNDPSPMTHLMYFWYITVGIVLLTFLVNFIHYLVSHKRSRKHHHLIGLSRERDIFYIPGDKLEDDEFDE